MFQNYWLKIFVAGLILISSLALAVVSEPEAPTSYESHSKERQAGVNRSENRDDDNQADFRFYSSWHPEAQAVSIVASGGEQILTGERELSAAEANLLAQERVAHWTAWIGVFTALGLFALIWTLLETQQLAAATRRTLDIEVEPFLSVEPEDSNAIEWTGEAFHKNDEPTEELWFRIRNSGKSTAIVESVYREWFVGTKIPPPLDERKEAFTTDSNSIFKETHLPIGGGSLSGPIRMFVCKCPKGNAESDQIYFYGVIKFKDQNEAQYEAGFCFMLHAGRFLMAWPTGEKAKRYNYHKRH